MFTVSSHLGLTYIIAVDFREGAVLIVPASIHVDSVLVGTDCVPIATARDGCATVRLNIEVHLIGRRSQMNTGLAL